MATLVKRDKLVIPSSAIGPIKKGMEGIDFRALDLFPSGGGGARGINTQGDVLTQTIDGRSLNDIWGEFQASLAVHNRFRQVLIDLLTFNVQQPIEDVPIITGDDFEEATEFGEPKGIRGGGYHSMGYDFRWYDLAVRYTWQFLSESGAAQVDTLNNMALEADNRLVFSRIMKAIFNNVTRAADIRNQNINVYPFYNGDSIVPPAFKNYVHSANHNHYLVSGAAVIDSGDFDEMELHLKHHGHGGQNGGTQLALVNAAQMPAIRALRVATGAAYDFIPAQGGPPFLLPVNYGGIQGGQPPSTYQGLDVAGRYGRWLVIEEDYIPAGYVLATSTGGEVAASNPVGIREHQNTGLRGLRLLKGHDQAYPLIDSFYNRGFGTGIRHRGAGVVLQIKASGTYDIPEIYA